LLQFQASEGIDFADSQARGVVMVGIPFPSSKDPKVQLKKAFNDNNSTAASKGRPVHRSE